MGKHLSTFLIACCLCGAGSLLLIKPASADGNVPAEITQAVDDAKASVQAIAGISTVALAVGLSPLGAMLSLRFLNMILSRV